jgi:coproporphyrinogen III oxidase
MTSPPPEIAALEDRKARARSWFETLREDLCGALEAVEDNLPAGAPFAQPFRPHALEPHRS